ncbi:MAG: YlxR family protein [Ruminococcaceae bacterium]|nr:YlxR family protein [Oscillospiraceae bacterium]
MKKSQPLRQCTGCQEMRPKSELLRVVRTPEGNITLDRSGKLNGRGAYICNNVECYKKAVKARRFEKAFSMQIPEAVVAQIAKELGQNEQ